MNSNLKGDCQGPGFPLYSVRAELPVIHEGTFQDRIQSFFKFFGCPIFPDQNSGICLILPLLYPLSLLLLFQVNLWFIGSMFVRWLFTKSLGLNLTFVLPFFSWAQDSRLRSLLRLHGRSLQVFFVLSIWFSRVLFQDAGFKMDNFGSYTFVIISIWLLSLEKMLACDYFNDNWWGLLKMDNWPSNLTCWIAFACF